jgi:hypothetical protein
MGLEDNRIAGEELDLELCSFFKGKISPEHSYFDFYTDKALFEVKSCHAKIKDGVGRKLRSGRFSIHKDSHDLIAMNASDQKKYAIYIFVLLDDKHQIIAKRILNWIAINKLLLILKPIHRGDYQFKHEIIFGDLKHE